MLNRSDLNNIATWCNKNRMAINQAKTKVMMITTKQKLRNLTKPDLDITLD